MIHRPRVTVATLVVFGSGAPASTPDLPSSWCGRPVVDDDASPRVLAESEKMAIARAAVESAIQVGARLLDPLDVPDRRTPAP